MNGHPKKPTCLALVLKVVYSNNYNNKVSLDASLIDASDHYGVFSADESFHRREAGIPGLEFSNDDEESRRRRVSYFLLTHHFG
jgi:hypothetical protein